MRSFLCLCLFFCNTLAAQDEYLLTLPSGDVGSNLDEFSIAVVLDTEEELVAIEFFVCHDTDLAELDSVDERIHPRFEPDYFYAEIFDEGFLVEVLYEEDSYPTRRDSIVEATYTVLGSAGDDIAFEFCGDVTDPPTPPSFETIDDETIEPDIVEGEIRLVDEVVFQRGDCDGNGRFHHLVDVLCLLNWGFNDGPEPPCIKAVDVDASGGIDPIIEVVRMIGFGFGPGDPPADPFGFCGVDPDPDSDLTCEYDGPCPPYIER